MPEGREHPEMLERKRPLSMRQIVDVHCDRPLEIEIGIEMGIAALATCSDFDSDSDFDEDISSV
jgi:hypothetical protein